MFDSPARIVIRNVSADFCAVAGEAPAPSSAAARTAAPNLNCTPMLPPVNSGARRSQNEFEAHLMPNSTLS